MWFTFYVGRFERMTEKNDDRDGCNDKNDDRDGCNDNYDGNDGNFDDNAEKITKTIIMNFG